MFEVAADAYDRHIGRYGRSLARRLIGAAGVHAGQRALDVGCGPGALTGELVNLLGDANVAAVEPSPTFAAACRARHPGVRVEQAPAEAIPFADATFDAALAQLVVNFMSDASAGVGQMMRVTRPGGTVAAAVWDYRGEMTLLRTFWDAAAAVDPAAVTRDEAAAMRYCDPPELSALWSQVGLRDVVVDAAVVSADYAGFADLWAPFEAGVGPAGAYATSLEHGARAALRDEMRRRLGVDEEPFTLTARAWIAVGRVTQ